MKTTYQVTEGKNGYVKLDSREDKIWVHIFDQYRARISGHISLVDAIKLRDDLDEVIREIES